MPKDFTARFAKRLSELRGSSSRDELSAATGVPKFTLRNWEEGKVGKIGPGVLHLVALADHFGVTLDYLIDRGSDALPVGKVVVDREGVSRILQAETFDEIADLILVPDKRFWVEIAFVVPEGAKLVDIAEGESLQAEVESKLRELHRNAVLAEEGRA